MLERPREWLSRLKFFFAKFEHCAEDGLAIHRKADQSIRNILPWRRRDPTSRSPFLRLPPEIRQSIYLHVWSETTVRPMVDIQNAIEPRADASPTSETAKNPRRRSKKDRTSAVRLLRICRLCYSEAMPLYYNSPVFHNSSAFYRHFTFRFQSGLPADTRVVLGRLSDLAKNHIRSTKISVPLWRNPPPHPLDNDIWGEKAFERESVDTKAQLEAVAEGLPSLERVWLEFAMSYPIVPWGYCDHVDWIVKYAKPFLRVPKLDLSCLETPDERQPKALKKARERLFGLEAWALAASASSSRRFP